MNKFITTFALIAVTFIGVPAYAIVDESNVPPADVTELVFVPVVVPTSDTTDLSEPQPTVVPPADVTDLSEPQPTVVPPADVTDLSEPQPTVPTTPTTPTITPGSQTGVSGTSGGGSSFVSTLPTTQSVLGATTGPTTGATCTAVITKYMKLGDRDTEVAKLQVVLNAFLGKKLAITGVYDKATFDAVVEFQNKHSKLVLKPWVDAGIMNAEIATGRAYITTIHTINSMLCGGNYGPLPALK